MFALGMRRVLEFLRSMSWMVRRAGTRQGEKRGGEEGKDPGQTGQTQSGRGAQGGEMGAGAGRWVESARAGGRTLESLSQDREGAGQSVIPFPGAQTAGHQLNCEADA